MWRQKAEFPHLPFPYIIYTLIHQIKAKNGFQTKGLFRISGNLKFVNDFSKELGISKDFESISEIDLNDACSLLKQWFRDLETPLIPYEIAIELEKPNYREKCVDYANQLPKSHKYTLMYLVGFLKDALQYSDKTAMQVTNLAIVFGPNLLQLQDSRKDQRTMTRYATLGNDILVELVNKWDTSEIYPFEPLNPHNGELHEWYLSK